MATRDSFGDVFGGALGNIGKELISLAATSGESLATLLAGVDVFQTVADALLSTVEAHPVLHVGIILASAALQYGRKTGQRMTQNLSSLPGGPGFNPFTALEKVNANMNVQNQGNEFIDNLMLALLDPNLEGIPITTVSLQRSGDVEVAQSTLLSAQGAFKSQRQDNAVPRPLTWSLDGYLNSLTTMLDAGITVKPTLAIQLRLLEAYRKSRKPLLFKDNQMRFYKVLMTHLEYTDTPENMNTVHIRLNLIEFAPLTVVTDNLQSILATPGLSAKGRKDLSNAEAKERKEAEKLKEAQDEYQQKAQENTEKQTSAYNAQQKADQDQARYEADQKAADASAEQKKQYRKDYEEMKKDPAYSSPEKQAELDADWKEIEDADKAKQDAAAASKKNAEKSAKEAADKKKEADKAQKAADKAKKKQSQQQQKQDQAASDAAKKRAA